MALGPVEYLVISFPGNQFNGDIAPAIADLVNRGVVRILDMAFVKKDAEGNIATFEISDLPETADFADIDGDADGMFNDDDIAIAASALEPDSSALFVVWEDLWANDLALAIRGAGGELVIGERIARDVAEAAVARVESSSTSQEGTS